MIDREKVIKGLEICYSPPSKCENCPYHDLPDDQSCNDVLCLDALALLKELEAVEPILKREGRNKYYNYYVCGCCDNDLFYQQNYCSECGRPVKWE